MLPSLVTDIDNLFTSVSSIWLRFFEDTCPPPSGPQFPIVATTIDFPLRTYKIGVANLEEFSQFGTVSRPSYEQAVLFRPIMVELFPAGFPQTPERVIVPILHVSTQKVPTLEALHRPSLTETGPACGIFTRFICNGLNQLKLFKQSRFFRVAQVRQRIGSNYEITLHHDSFHTKERRNVGLLRRASVETGQANLSASGSTDKQIVG